MTPDDNLSEIEKAFNESWDRIEPVYELFFTDSNGEWVHLLRNLIAELRKRGYDIQLRAGQQMGTFILSRSRHNGLIEGQAHLDINAIHVPENVGMIVRYYGPPDMYIEKDFKQIGFSTELEELLLYLLKCPID